MDGPSSTQVFILQDTTSTQESQHNCSLHDNASIVIRRNACSTLLLHNVCFRRGGWPSLRLWGHQFNLYWETVRPVWLLQPNRLQIRLFILRIVISDDPLAKDEAWKPFDGEIVIVQEAQRGYHMNRYSISSCDCYSTFKRSSTSPSRSRLRKIGCWISPYLTVPNMWPQLGLS